MATKLTPAQLKAKLASFEAQGYRAFRKFVADHGGTYTTSRSIDSGQPYHLIWIYVDLPDESYSLIKQGDWSSTRMLLEDMIEESRKLAAA